MQRGDNNSNNKIYNLGYEFSKGYIKTQPFYNQLILMSYFSFSFTALYDEVTIE